MSEIKDISIDGPGSPISIKKVLEQIEPKPITLFVDGSGCGIAQDDESLIYITPSECSSQALYYSKSVFDGKCIPAYLYRYLGYMFGIGKDYQTDEELVKDFADGVITEESVDYKQILNLIKYCENNDEAKQVIGLIQLVGGALNIAKKQQKYIRLYIDKPETSLHPNKQSKIATLLIRLRDRYGFNDSTFKEA
jgi:hypothetical protein